MTGDVACLSLTVFWEFPNLVVLNLIVSKFFGAASLLRLDQALSTRPNFVIFTQKHSFALFCALAFALFCALAFALFCGLAFALFCDHLRSFALICVFLHPTALRTTALGNCRVLCSLETVSALNYRCHEDSVERMCLLPKAKEKLEGSGISKQPFGRGLAE